MAAVVAVIVALLVLNSNHDSGTGPVVSEPTGGLPTTPAPAATTPAPTPTPTHHRSPHPSPTPSPSPHRTAPASAPPATTPPLPAKVPVSVLNNSRVSGLAHRVARELAGRSWPIAVVGNYRGRLAETTLYYLPGQLESARLLAREFGSVQRLLPRPARLPGRGMTLVVTRYWDP